MKVLPYIAQQLKNQGLSLAKKSILINKPWALIDEEMELQKLIFKKDGALVLSKNGEAQEGKWEYYPEARSILIDRVSNKILCNETYIDENAMILKIDGTDNRFFVLANENTIPDLDVITYLKAKVLDQLHVRQEKILGVGQVEVFTSENGWNGIHRGNKIFQDFEPLKDGDYEVENIFELPINETIIVKEGTITRVYYINKYMNPEGVVIVIHQNEKGAPKINDEILVEGRKPEDGWIALTPKMACAFSNGKIAKIKKKIFGSF